MLVWMCLKFNHVFDWEFVWQRGTYVFVKCFRKLRQVGLKPVSGPHISRRHTRVLEGKRRVRAWVINAISLWKSRRQFSVLNANSSEIEHEINSLWSATPCTTKSRVQIVRRYVWCTIQQFAAREFTVNCSRRSRGIIRWRIHWTQPWLGSRSGQSPLASTHHWDWGWDSAFSW